MKKYISDLAAKIYLQDLEMTQMRDTIAFQKQSISKLILQKDNIQNENTNLKNNIEDYKSKLTDLQKRNKKYERFIKSTCKLHQYQDLFESQKIFNQGKMSKLIDYKVNKNKTKKIEDPFEIANIEIKPDQIDEINDQSKSV